MKDYIKFTKRIEDLIKEFDEEIFNKKVHGQWTGGDDYEYPSELQSKISSWLIRVENILFLIFSDMSIQMKRYRVIKDSKNSKLYTKLNRIKGLLEGCLDDIKNGFLQGQEFIIANEIFDSVLEKAGFFLKEQKDKNIAAILLRIVLEDTIKRISVREGLSVLDVDGKNKKVSVLNDELKTKDFYNQTVWRQIQAWLDIGNYAAHGDFEKYDLTQVSSFCEGLTNFITKYFN